MIQLEHSAMLWYVAESSEVSMKRLLGDILRQTQK